MLSRMYLNAETWIGTDRYADCYAYAKRIITSGGVLVGDVKAEGFGASVNADDIGEDGIIVKKGKKTFHRFIKG